MPARGSGGGRRGGASANAHSNDERWLLTYADMITLLMALFMVLFSISSVNISKYITLQQSLKAAFSGSILPGGRAILQSGSQSTANHTPATSEVPSIEPLTPNVPKPVDEGDAAQNLTSQQTQNVLKEAQAASQEQSQFAALQYRIRQYAQAHGFAKEVTTQIQRRGLVVTVLTDKLLFASGSASLEPAGLPLLNELSNLVNIDKTHPVVVEGYTDDVPIDTTEFPSNWELSTSRASTVVRYMISRGVNQNRLGAAGYADLHPVAGNATAAGRALNRRVEIVFERLNPYQAG
jgi:chemotaxis protein MotB